MYGKREGEIIENGITIVDGNNAEVTVNYLISDAGGQGDVYHVTYKDKDYAMKWYCKHPDDVIGGPQYKIISRICGEENRPSDKIIWPLFLVTEEKPAIGKRFGYLMELIPDNYYDMVDYFRIDGDPKAVCFSSYHAMLNAGLNIAAAMRDIHIRGFVYQDFHPGNIVINPKNGDVFVVDNDNISVGGGLCTVWGTKGYMAPEIHNSNYEVYPAMETDRYSLAVVLYRLFFIDHPLEGKAWEKYPLHTVKVEDYLYAEKPVFHFDPENDSNRPSELYALNAFVRWRAMPKELRNTFTRTFTKGLFHPLERPTEGEWVDVISKARDSLILLEDGREQFVNFDDIRTVPSGCLGMTICRNVWALYPGKEIYEMSVSRDYRQFAKVYADIVYDKEKDCMMIRNLSDKEWRGFVSETKQLTVISKGQDYEIKPGVMIEFQRDNPKIVGEIFDPRVIKIEE